MRERTIEEKLFHQLMRLERMMKRPEHDERRPEEGEERRGPNFAHRRPPLAREHILFLISSFEGGVHQKELIERMHVNPSSMSEFIGKLEEDGYLKREVDPEDKRATLLSLSELGYARISELQDERSDRLNQLFGNLSQEEKEQLSLLLAKILPERKCHRHHSHEVQEEQ
jgi:DNA-binding MarR family transcriptional regulator